MQSRLSVTVEYCRIFYVNLHNILFDAMVDNVIFSQLLDCMIERKRKENRFLEFKSNYQDAHHLGEYISALSNGACLDRQDFGYLFFGVDDDTLAVKGTTFDVTKLKAKGNQALALYLKLYIDPKIDFHFEEFLYHGKERIVVMIVPAALGQPTCFMGTPYIRIDSHVTSLVPYLDWIREIYNSGHDWTAEVVPGTSLKDLDAEAIKEARKGFKERFPKLAKDCDGWNDKTFLDRAKLTRDGKITRATLLLVGKEESAHFLEHISQLVWKLQTKTETAGEIFTIPYVLTTSRLLKKIRNYRFKIYRDDKLIPAEVWKYDEEMVLEALHNCIAHQQFERNSRIIVTETENDLTFWNAGSFFDGSYEDYVLGTKTPSRYRNHFLAESMVNIKMIDTKGLGIHTLFQKQRERYLPMPEYDLSDPGAVSLTIPGSVLDIDYSLMLIKHADLDLETAILLDRVQKHKSISAEAVKMLRGKHLVEGRKNALIVAKSIAQATEQEAEYTRAKGFSDEFCMDLIDKAVHEHDNMTRAKIEVLLFPYLPEGLVDSQKSSKVGNLLTKMRKEGRIHPIGGKVWAPGPGN